MFPTIPNRRPTIGPRYIMKQQCTLDISIEYMEIFHNCPKPWAPLVFLLFRYGLVWYHGHHGSLRMEMKSRAKESLD